MIKSYDDAVKIKSPSFYNTIRKGDTKKIIAIKKFKHIIEVIENH